MEKPYPIYSRFYTRKKTTDYGEVHLKSLSKIKTSSKSLIPVLDDRPDLWDESGVELIPIDPWHGEKDDQSLRQIMIKALKKQDRIQELTQPNDASRGKGIAVKVIKTLNALVLIEGVGVGDLD